MRKLATLAVLALVCLTALGQANQDPYYARRATLFDELPIGKKDIVMLGNSLTDGCEIVTSRIVASWAISFRA